MYNAFMASLPERRTSAARFATTRWSVVLAARCERSLDSQQALSSLCESYWYPAYAYVRGRGHRRDEAEDLTQGFFARLLEKDALRAADPGRGRFRSFLLGSLQNFLANKRRDAMAKKRGGGRVALSLDFRTADERYSLEPAHELTPERIYERRWALTLLELCLAKLSQELERSGKGDRFGLFKEFLAGESSRSYKEVAGELGMTEGAIKVSVHRLRRRYREILREEIAQTVAAPEDVDEELQHLLSILSE